MHLPKEKVESILNFLFNKKMARVWQRAAVLGFGENQENVIIYTYNFAN